MSIFASRTQRLVAMSFDEPRPDGSLHVVTIQKLAGRHMEKAKSVHLAGVLADVRQIGGATALQNELSGLGSAEATAKKIAEMQADPLNGLDRYTVLAKGIKAWTYDESLTPEEVTLEDGTKALRIKAIDDLDDFAADFLAREIVALTRPAEGDEARKKSSPTSIARSTVTDGSPSSTTSDGSAKNSAALSPA